jgi:hypothetical protein
LQQAGVRVVAPVTVNGHIEYRELTATTRATGFGNGLPQQSPKAAWFPRSEPILKFQRKDREWSVEDPELGFPPVVVFGARPCDAAAPAILAPLFGWDFHDPFFEQRMKAVVVIALACKGPMDNACFCTSVGVDPAGKTVATRR